MRYLKAALVALVGAVGFAMVATILAGARCGNVLGVPVCHAAVPFRLRLVFFVLGFAAVFGWFVQGRRRLPGL